MQRFTRLIPLAVLAAAPLQAQDPETTSFVTRLGRDTLAAETLRRTPAELTGELVVFTPQTRVHRYTFKLTAAGTVHAATLETYAGDAAAGAAPLQRVAMERHETRVTMVVTRGRQSDTTRLEVPAGTIPNLSNSMAVYEQMSRQAARQGGERVATHLLALASGATVQENAVVRHARDTVAIDFFGSPHLLHVDEAGRLLGMDGSGSTFKVVAERVDGPLDLKGLAAAGAARDRAGSGLGALSTRDTARAMIAGADLSVDYGRPAVRGRQILGEVVPFGQVWRTGANNPTMFTTSRPLEIGGRPLPAGSYTILSLPHEGGAEIIFSQQPGSTAGHDPAHDVIRIPADVQQAPAPVERLTMTLEPGTDGAGTLVVAWHTFVWRVPFRVR